MEQSQKEGGAVCVSEDEPGHDSASLSADSSCAERPGEREESAFGVERVLTAPAAVKGAGARVVSKVASIPVRSAGTAGRAVMLAGSVVRYAVVDTVLGRLAFGELIVQAWSLLKVTALPAVLMAIPFGAMVAVQISGLVNEVGANSLVGSVTGVAVLRQGAPVTAGLLMGGAAAAAIASDFGARAIREELDALRTLGIDPVQRLVVPRFLALLLITPILVVIVIAMGVGAAFLIATLVNDVTPGSFWLSFGSFAKMVDVWFTMGKGFLFAAIVAVISAQRGMEAKGGPRGVADAVNASVVLNVIFIIVVNLVITQLQTMFFPMAVA
ncbi:ABC transporter permease [Mycobacteroides abscessus]|uniref:ABC transporter permease n=1 Tax=Mycobacteroides abscessus TaxID=36809 RepID=UPI0005DBC3BF|nr:ABC transporter permease [Mycobacteroides abscessus]CPS43632.1 ABC transporter transmembrane protein [Mycobacteroides abscessus]CPS45472.1 ABC transporter transmembrane protein [Mycobacteroides abscessus]CPS54523.1 ABC transporter transmembrane protein [Mycobacteroides abscessus]CPT37222.1 ABC transporter transmembrane protein [Mycobacteroides abscessus]CPT64310.1 ABC transporter transmembrane protein [Mycobacteroides abscessus]